MDVKGKRKEKIAFTGRNRSKLYGGNALVFHEKPDGIHYFS